MMDADSAQTTSERGQSKQPDTRPDKVVQDESVPTVAIDNAEAHHVAGKSMMIVSQGDLVNGYQRSKLALCLHNNVCAYLSLIS